MRTKVVSGYEKGANNQPPETPAHNVPEQSYHSSVIDLTAHMQQKVQNAPPPASSAQPEGAVGSTGNPATETKQGATFDTEAEKKFKQFEETAAKTMEGFVADPKAFSEMAVKTINLIRCFLYPIIFKAMILEGREKREIEPLLDKIAEAEKQNKEPELNNYEKKLRKKWDEYLELKKRISLTKEEITLCATVLEKEFQKVPIMEWLQRHPWALLAFYIESQRFVPAIGVRMQNSMMRDFHAD